MKRFFTGLLFGVSLVLFAVLAGWPPFFGTIKSLTLIALISVLAGIAFCGIFYELDQHSGKGLSSYIGSNPSRRWFWWGMMTALLDSVLILGTVLISAAIIKRVPALADQFGLILASVGILSIALVPAATVVAIRSKLMTRP